MDQAAQGTDELHALGTVSYTHLDVYKRQEVHAAVGGEIEHDLGAVEGVFGLHQLHFQPVAGEDVYKRQMLRRTSL